MDRHYVMDRLAKYFHVVWMHQPDWRECLAGLKSNGNGIESLSAPRRESLHVYPPEYWLPRLGRPAWLGNFTLRQRLKHAREMLRAQGCTKVVLYIWRPEFAEALEQLPHDFSVYHVNDEYTFSSKMCIRDSRLRWSLPCDQQHWRNTYRDSAGRQWF